MIATVTCDYCAHRNSVAAPRCAHCGAPLPEAEEPAVAAADSDNHGGPKWLSEPATVLSKELFTAKQGPIWWMWAVGAVVVAAVVIVVWLGYLVVHRFHMPASVSDGVAAEYLPDQLRQAASCRLYDARAKTDKCVVRAGDPLLGDSISGGRDLTFYINVVARDQVSSTIDTLRPTAAAVVEDDTVFAAIGNSANVLYVNTATGLRISTGTFGGQSGARMFLSRAGLSG